MSSPHVNARLRGGSTSMTSPCIGGISPPGNSKVSVPPGVSSPLIALGNQWASSAGSVTARQTRSTEWARRRSKVSAERSSTIS